MALDYALLNSQAFIELSYSARCALLYFWAKVKLPLKDPKRYTTSFSFSYTEAKKYGFTTRTFARVIPEIMRHGFIDPVERGGLRGMRQSESLFKLSERWREYAKSDFEKIEWQHFEPSFKFGACARAKSKAVSPEENVSMRQN